MDRADRQSELTIAFQHTFHDELDGFYESVEPETLMSPRLIRLNMDLASELGIDSNVLSDSIASLIFSGNALPKEAKPIAQVYAGHQFGMFSPQLGDGRALLLGELIDRGGVRRDIQLKGSGRTPFSRGGDGKAALAPVLREYLVSESMHALGIPTTRALAAVVSADKIRREGFKPRAVFTRVASSHIRVGSFEFFAARGDINHVRRLADYAIVRHYPECAEAENKYQEFFVSVLKKQAELVSLWMSVGFIHGVMNTDNMTISGETIDYGPCAFMDRFVPSTVFSSIDHHGRYAFENQPKIAKWNLANLAKALIPLSGGDQDVIVNYYIDALDRFDEIYAKFWLENMRRKLGLHEVEDDDRDLVEDFQRLMHEGRVDFTLAFRYLSDALLGNEGNLVTLFESTRDIHSWLDRWRCRVNREGALLQERSAVMNQINPIYIPRNHNVEEALEEAELRDNFTLFDRLFERITEPFCEVPGGDVFAQPAPIDAPPHVTYCGT